MLTSTCGWSTVCVNLYLWMEYCVCNLYLWMEYCVCYPVPVDGVLCVLTRTCGWSTVCVNQYLCVLTCTVAADKVL